MILIAKPGAQVQVSILLSGGIEEAVLPISRRSALALFTPAEMAQADRLAQDLKPVSALIDAAGRAVARAVRRHFRPCRVLVVCGPGNNGADGYAAARYLFNAGWPVAVASCPDGGGRAEALESARLLKGARVPFTPAEAERADLVIDAVFGAGLKRDLANDVSDLLQAARRIVAIDVPSGVDGATGALCGVVSPAEMTVTFVRFKPGHLLYPARSLMGKLVLADIGMPDVVHEQVVPRTWCNEPGLWQLPLPSPEDHKYSRGVVSICAGHVMPGAARLCAGGARAVGAGLVRVAAGSDASAYRMGMPGLVVDEEPLGDLMADSRRRVWVCGPGLTEAEALQALPVLLRAKKTILADAGLLSACAGNPEKLRGVAVMTPHSGEFTRLFGAPEADLPEQVRRAARLTCAVVVLKGASTLIAAPDGRLAINNHASPALATAGSGDTLSGVIAALLAAGMSAWEAACAGVWLHGEAGLEAGSWPLAEDLDRFLGSAREKATRLQMLSSFD
ncbi:NAD(P)H-hydrate dehydratase [Acetobacter thailandicus]|nr:NAD(P)H-hydrate dehydratase [Acetobacter thailandicus]